MKYLLLQELNIQCLQMYLVLKKLLVKLGLKK